MSSKVENATTTSTHIKHNIYFIGFISKKVKSQTEEEIHRIISKIYEQQ